MSEEISPRKLLVAERLYFMMGLTRTAISAIAPGVTNVIPQTLPCVIREGGFLEDKDAGPNKIDFNIFVWFKLARHRSTKE